MAIQKNHLKKTEHAKSAEPPKSAEQLLRKLFHNKELAFLQKEKKIDLPPGLGHKHIIPDFYLTEHNISVEFMRNWDDPRFRLRLLEKRELYKKAVLPCIFIYPKDLNNLENIFSERLAEAQQIRQHNVQDTREANFSLMVAVLCILFGIPLLFIRYTRILGWIAFGYGIVLLILRNPRSAAHALKLCGWYAGIGLTHFGRYVVFFLAAMGRGGIRLIILLWKWLGIFLKLLWKLTKLLSIYLWIAVRALLHALWWLLIRVWYGLLTGLLWLWHSLIWLSAKLWIGTKVAGKGVRIGGKSAGKGLGFLLVTIWQGALSALHSIGAGAYQAKHALKEKAKEIKQRAEERRRAEREMQKIKQIAQKKRSSKEKGIRKGIRKNIVKR